MELLDLYSYAKRHDVPVISHNMPKSESMSVLIDGECFIGIDPFAVKTEADEKVKLAHELGHCETGAFYNEYAVCDVRAKHERRANIWAIKKLVPKDELMEALKSSFCENRYELSQHFNVTEDFMQKALDYYLGE